MNRRSLMLSVAAVIAATGIYASYRLGQHEEMERSRDVWLDEQANSLAITVEIAAMTRAGDIGQALKWSENMIDGQLIGLDAFAQPDRPAFDKPLLNALKLTSIYRLKYQKEHSESAPASAQYQDRIDHVLSIVDQRGEVTNPALVKKYLSPNSTFQPTTLPPTRPSGG